MSSLAGVWVFPLDPECPAVDAFNTALFDDPLPAGAPVDEIQDVFRRKHRAKCDRCYAYGASNTEVGA